MSVATTTSGSLPRTAALIEANAARALADDGFTLQSTPEFEALTARAVADVVERQRAAGITLVGDGEFGKAMSNAVDYGAWWSYSFQRVSGLSLTEINAFNEPPVRSEPGEIRLTSFLDRRDRQRFPAVYAEAVEAGRTATAFPTTTGPLAYRGQDAVASDIRHLTAALRPGEQGFLTAIAPGSAARVRNDYYATDEEHIFAWADALREEYRAIVDAGSSCSSTTLARRELRPDLPGALDRRLSGVHEDPHRRDQPRHRGASQGAGASAPVLGSWHGPHTTDIELKDILPVVLQANVGSISFEAGNVRHEHEFGAWADAAVPDDLVLVPGVVSHATNVVEHPELVAQRIRRFTDIVGADRVIASTDCGLGGRIHPDIAWAKLETLGEGARRA
jgi:5-methyltetrahydropteroyltriglutamate--homocysteine methyltransferase